MHKTKWIAMFSQTGSELQEICKRMNQWPDVVITNSSNIDFDAWKETKIIHISPGNLKSSFYRSMFDMHHDKQEEDVIVTLHGWLKIVPDDICEQYKIFNGHPGDIVKYPQLKGKDPQKKAFELKLPFSGCILHRCTKELDGGPIIAREEVCIMQCKTVDEVINKLKKVSISMWINLIKTLI